MPPDKKIRNDVPYKRECLVRVIVQFRNGTTSAGTGFFINNHGGILTCFHVISGTELQKFKMQMQADSRSQSGALMQTQMQTGAPAQTDVHTQPDTNIKNYLAHAIMSLQVELADGTRQMAELVNFDEEVDVAELEISSSLAPLPSSTSPSATSPSSLEKPREYPFFELDTNYTPEYDESTFFCGFQMTGGYDNPTQYPFSINRAVASAFPDTVVAGGRHVHIQLNSINLGGNSGAPLFAEGSNTVIGIINGNMNWNTGGTAGVIQAVPLCIAYATSMKLVKEKTGLLGK